MEQLGIVVRSSDLQTMQEFNDANSFKRTLLRELSLEFQSLHFALRLSANKTGFLLLVHSDRSASNRDLGGDG